MPEGDRVEYNRIQSAAAFFPEMAIKGTVLVANKAALLRSLDERVRLRSAALDLVGEVVGDYGAVNEKAVDLWRVEAEAMAEKEARDRGGEKVSDPEKGCLAKIVAREIRRPYFIAEDNGWGVDMEVILKRAALPGAFGSNEEKQRFLEGVKRSLDLTSLVNQKMPWRLFCQLNLSARVGETEKEEEITKPEVMLSTFMSSRSIDGLFVKIAPGEEESKREEAEATKKLADVCLLEAVLEEVATGVKTWDLAGAARASELSPMEVLLNESGLGLDSISTGVNRGFVWKDENRKVSRTEAVVTDSRISYLDRDGRYRIFDAATDRGRVDKIMKKRRMQPEEVILGLVYELGNDPVAIGKRTHLSVEEVLPMIARVRSIPTLVIHPSKKIGAKSTIEAFSKMRREAQELASERGRLNGTIIMGDVNFGLGNYLLTVVNNHAIRDGVEAAAMTARLGDRFQERLVEASAQPLLETENLIKNFAGDAELRRIDPEFFQVDRDDLRLGQVFPGKAELGGLPGEEVTVAVEVTGLWQQAEKIAAEFKRYRDEKRPGVKTILTSPYFVMEMLIQKMHQDASASTEIGVLLAQKGMADLDLHPVHEGIDVVKISKLMREAGKDSSQRKNLDIFLGEYMDTVKKDLAVSNMKPIETVARVAGPFVRRLINNLTRLKPLRPGVTKMGGADMLSILPRQESSTHGIAMDGPAMIEAQKRAITISGFIKIKGGGLAVLVTIKRNAQRGEKAMQANRWAHDFAGRMYSQIDARQRILAAGGYVE
jgi:hypothetical protein